MPLILLFVAGCEKYHARPLTPSVILMDVERARHLAAENETASSEPFTFSRAVELARVHSPALKQTRAEYETALALAKVRTPFPNPAVEVGPQYGFGPDVASTNRLQPFGSIGFTIPTGRRLKRQDELNQMQAELSRVELLVRGRELYLELRESYIRLAVSKQRITARQEIAESAEKSTTATKRLVEAGQGTGLDVGLIRLEQARLRTDALAAETTFAQVLGELSSLIGVHSKHFETIPESSLPPMKDSLPPLSELQTLLLNNHPELARVRAQYEVAERQLHLEIAKQYPDFHIGPSFQRDVGEKKNVLGLTLGIELPVFERNQQAVATAKQRREEIRVKYETAANRALAALDRAHRQYHLALERLKLLQTVVAPITRENIELARKSFEAGATDLLRLLETERGQRAVQLDALESELSVRAAWLDLEKATGLPLLLFPSETHELTPPALPGSAESTHEKPSEKEPSK